MSWIRGLFPNIGEFDLGKFESAYQQHHLKADIAQTTFGFLFFGALSLFFIRTDYFFFGTKYMFFVVVGVRLISAAVSVGIIYFIQKVKTVQEFQSLVLILMFNTIVVIAFIDWTRPTHRPNPMSINALLILAMYLILPIPIKFRALGTGLLTLFEFVNLTRRTAGVELWFTVGTTYLVANFLGLAISHWINSYRRYNFSLLKMEEQEKKRLRRLAMIDPLTQAKNRRAFTTQGKIEVERAKRHGRQLSVAIIDMDTFKNINDSFGHSSGDKILRQFVRVIKQHIRKQDVFARLGGDEFGLLMPETGQKEAMLIVDRIMEICRQTNFSVSKNKVSLSISIGALEHDGHTFDNLLQDADKLLYLAKQKGGNQIVWGSRDFLQDNSSNTDA